MERLPLDHARTRTLIEQRLDGEPLTATESNLLRAHLDSCPDCRQAYDRALVFRRAAAGVPLHQPTGLESRLLFEETMARLSQSPAETKSPFLRLLLASLLPAAAVAALVVVLLPAGPAGDPDFRPSAENLPVRGTAQALPDAGLGVSGIAIDGAEYEAVESDGVCLADALRFYLTARRSDLSYYFLFGIQEGTPLWYFPSRREASSPVLPGEGRIAWKVPFEIELAHRHRPGPLRLVLLLSPGPLTVDEVSDWVTRGGASGAPETIPTSVRTRFGNSTAAAWAEVSVLDCGGRP